MDVADQEELLGKAKLVVLHNPFHFFQDLAAACALWKSKHLGCRLPCGLLLTNSFRVLSLPAHCIFSVLILLSYSMWDHALQTMHFRPRIPAQALQTMHSSPRTPDHALQTTHSSSRTPAHALQPKHSRPCTLGHAL